MVRLHWLGMKVHFQTFVVACVKLKKNVARAKKTVFTILEEKKSFYHWLYKKNK